MEREKTGLVFWPHKTRVTNWLLRAQPQALASARFAQCDYLLSGLEPIAFTAGLYGWNADVYQLPEGGLLCAGYRPVGQSVGMVGDWFNSAARSLENREGVYILLGIFAEWVRGREW